MRRLLVLLLLVGLSLPFLGKPVHLDDANFLVLARGALLDPWRPHAAPINWQGHLEPAFAVLSNPPGIAWWLAPVVDASDPIQHLWMLLWLPLAAWGAWTLGRHYADEGAAAAILIVGSPIAVLAAQSRMPDLPLLACTLAGMGGIVGGPVRRRWPWALVLGCAGLFRYSGIALVPLAALVPLTRRDVRGALLLGLLGALPLGLLALHDLSAYGEVHLLAMRGFQGVAETPRDVGRKLIASVAALGGAAVLPLLCWARPRGGLLGLLVGVGLGWAGVVLSGQEGWAALGTLAFGGAGGAVIVGSVRLNDPKDVVLSAWLMGGLLFLFELRFTAARYWLPFFAPAVLLGLREAGPRAIRRAVLITPVLSLWLALDDLELARAQARLATEVAGMGTGAFAGHWGWQHHLEARGWTAIEEDAPLRPGELFAWDEDAWPQVPAEPCLEGAIRIEISDRWPGPRVHTREGAANLHASLIAGDPPIETYSPWGFGSDSLDAAGVGTGCAP